MAFDAQTSARDLKRLLSDDMELNPQLLERDYLNRDLTRLISFFGLSNLPETVPKYWALLNAFSYGAIYLHKYDGPDKYGIPGAWYLCPGGLGGDPGPDYEPLYWVGANAPMNWDYEYKKDDPDGCLIKCDSLMLGVLPVLRKWARMRAAADVSIYMGLINTRLQTVFEAPDDNTYKATLAMFDGIKAGELCAVIENRRGALLKAGMSALPFGSSQASNILRETVEVRQYLEGLHWSDLGISAPYNMKREALNSAETGLADEMTRTYMDDVLANLSEGFAKIGVTVTYENALKTIDANTAEIERAINPPEPEPETEGGGDDEPNPEDS